ncbi:MAG: hypothetical protein E7H60_19195 [Pseudomonas oryzihabitans]|uniref:hypothetical protein n=1 Tax=Pseudomonas oryzihabitans TaxID=47885 RepID=UPI00290A4280|nr:hypothetical protein [Pseudomonas oryzihabitans]MDU4058669.1 hypothetical protein [Pseudomonas oryzihabitans]
MFNVLEAFSQVQDSAFRHKITAILGNCCIVDGHICGQVYGDRLGRFSDGSRMMTSRINFSFVEMGRQIVRTNSGHYYLICGWKSFDSEWLVDNFIDGDPRTSDFLYKAPSTENKEAEREMTNSLHEELKAMEMPVEKFNRGITRRERHSIFDETDEEDLHLETFRVAADTLSKDCLTDVLDRTRQKAFAVTKKLVLIEYTAQRPSHHILYFLGLGLLPTWQAILVLDGDFNISKATTNCLADELLLALPGSALSPDMRQRRLQIDLGL